MFSSEKIQNKVINLKKIQAKTSSSDQNFEKQEEELIEFKEEHHDALRKSSSGPIQK